MLVEEKYIDEWYREINSIYLRANYYRTVESLFAHFLELYGAISPSALDRQIARIPTDELFAKAIGWWMTICGKVGIPSVQQILWAKFPRVCPYCLKYPHENDVCEKIREEGKDANWTGLNLLIPANMSQWPLSIQDWQRMLYRIYQYDKFGSMPYTAAREGIFIRLGEEISEMSEAIRLLPVTHLFFLNEATDVFAWLMRYLSHIELGPDKQYGRISLSLTSSLQIEYPGQCKACENPSCVCPPFPDKKAQRISRTVDEGKAFADIQIVQLMTFQEAVQVFREGTHLYRLNTLAVERTEIKLVLDDLKRLLEKVSDKSDSLAALTVKVDRVIENQVISQASIDSIVVFLNEMPSEDRQIFQDFAINFSSSAIFQAFLMTLDLAKNLM